SKRQKRIGNQPMLELDQQNIVEEIPPERREKSQFIERRPKISVDQRPRVERAPRAQAGDEATEPDLQKNEQHHGAGKPLQPRQSPLRDWGQAMLKRSGEPNERSKRQRRQQQMNREPFLGDLDALR